VQLRLPPSLQKDLAAWAIEERVSLNALALAILERAVAERDATSCNRESGEAGR
jgi:predicted HicB family RNase H-like nuclease